MVEKHDESVAMKKPEYPTYAEDRDKEKDVPLHTRNGSAPSVLLIGTETRLFSPGPVRERILSYGKGMSKYSIIVLTKKSEGFTLLKEGSLSVIPTNARFRISMPLRAARIGCTLPQHDIISSEDPFESGVAAWLVSLKHRSLLELQLHTDVFSPAFRGQSFLNTIRFLLARFLLPRADRIRVVSQRIYDSLPPHLARKAAILPIMATPQHATTAEHIKQRFSGYAFKLLFVGRLEAEKNIDVILRALAKVPVSVCLIILGKGRLEKGLRRCAEELGVGKRVFFEGWVDPAPYYQAANLLVHASRFEGYGLVFEEAAMVGLPILATDIGIAREVGARITSREEFAHALADEIRKGPRRKDPLPPRFRTPEEYCQAVVRGWMELYTRR